MQTGLFLTPAVSVSVDFGQPLEPVGCSIVSSITIILQM